MMYVSANVSLLLIGQYAQDGCDEIQGYWLAKPMPGEQALAFIQRWLPEPVSCEDVLEYQE